MKFSRAISIIILLIANPAYSETAIKNLKSKATVNTEILVLGSPHLNAIETQLDQQSLAPIIERLADFKPDAIAVESLRPQDIVTMLNGSDEYQVVLKQFVGEALLSLAKQQQQALRVSAKQAISSLESLLEQPERSNAQRIKIIQMAIAGYYIDTAILQWKYLAKQPEKSKVSAELKRYLDALLASNNETIQIAVELASQLNLERIYAFDDHLDKDVYAQMQRQLMPSFAKSKDGAAFAQSDYFKKLQRMQEQALKNGNWLPYYHWVNSNEYMNQVINTEWKLFIDSDIDAKAGAARIALWEVRNLNMVSNIMRLAAGYPGGKIVVVVGSNHKVFIEQYLSNMLNIKLIQFNQLANNN